LVAAMVFLNRCSRYGFFIGEVEDRFSLLRLQGFEKTKAKFEDAQVTPSSPGPGRKQYQLACLLCIDPSGTLSFAVEPSGITNWTHEEVFVAGTRAVELTGYFGDDSREDPGLFDDFAEGGLLGGFSRLGFALGKSPDLTLVVPGGFAQQNSARLVNDNSAVRLFHKHACIPALRPSGLKVLRTMSVLIHATTR